MSETLVEASRSVASVQETVNISETVGVDASSPRAIEHDALGKWTFQAMDPRISTVWAARADAAIKINAKSKSMVGNGSSWPNDCLERVVRMLPVLRMDVWVEREIMPR